MYQYKRFKGTVSRDFRPSVFSTIKPTSVTDLWVIIFAYGWAFAEKFANKQRVLAQCRVETPMFLLLSQPLKQHYSKKGP
jgi:hypothetical protein